MLNRGISLKVLSEDVNYFFFLKIHIFNRSTNILLKRIFCELKSDAISIWKILPKYRNAVYKECDFKGDLKM